MKCPENQKKFYEAFYGIAPPDHLYRKVHKLFSDMVKRIRADLVSEFPGVSEETLAQGLLAGLKALHDEGAERPTVYGSHEHLTAVAFKAACVKIRGILKMIEDRKRADEYRLVEDEEYMNMLAHNQSLKANMMIELEGHIKEAIGDGAEGDVDAKVIGFLKLLDNHQHPEGYLFALLGWIIPNSELGIHYDTRVIEAMNAHPSLRSLKRKSTPGPLAGIVGGMV